MKQPIDQFDSTTKNNTVLLPVVITFILTVIIVGGGIYWWTDQKQKEFKNEIVSLRTQVDQLKQVSIPTLTTTPAPTPAPKDETANWKTYRNNANGFELKYPDIFRIDSDQNAGLSFSPKAFVRLIDSTGITTIDVALITEEQSKMPYGVVMGEETKMLKNPITKENMYFSLTTMIRLQAQEPPSALYESEMHKVFNVVVDSLRLTN